MKSLALLALLLCGCISTGKDSRGVGTLGMRTTVEAAASSTQKATQHAGAAKRSLQKAMAKSRELKIVASPSEQPLVQAVEQALEETQTELNATQAQLLAANQTLADSTGQLEALQGQFRAMSEALAQASEAENQLKVRRDFWRASAWKLGLLALGLGVWIFRKPLLMACGVFVP